MVSWGGSGADLCPEGLGQDHPESGDAYAGPGLQAPDNRIQWGWRKRRDQGSSALRKDDGRSIRLGGNGSRRTLKRNQAKPLFGLVQRVVKPDLDFARPALRVSARSSLAYESPCLRHCRRTNNRPVRAQQVPGATPVVEPDFRMQASDGERRRVIWVEGGRDDSRVDLGVPEECMARRGCPARPRRGEIRKVAVRSVGSH